MGAREDGSGSNGSGQADRAGPATDHEIGVSNHIVKVVEILAESPRSWEDAVQVALREAARSLRNIASIYVQDMQAVVRDGRVAAWRVNAKVSFVVSDEHGFQINSVDTSTGGDNMGQRDQNEGRDNSNRPWREGNAFPEYEEYGLHGENRREYRGRESYEQQSRGGQGGRSGMWPHRNVPRDRDERWRNNADEDGRGYQSLGTRSEFESADRNRPDYGRYGRPNDRDPDEARYGFDARDYGTDAGNRSQHRDQERHYGYGNRGPSRDFNREYGAREYGSYDRADANRSSSDDYSRTDYGERTYRAGRDAERDFGYDSNRDYGYGTPYSRPSNYNSSYDQGNENRGGGYAGNAGNYGSRSWNSGPERGFYDQGRIAEREYDRSQFRTRTGLGPKSYKRSDERIREDVCDRLGHDWELDASEVEVTVANGEVTLTGTINDRAQKFRVEHIADSISGVNEVHNQLRVKRELPVQGSTQSSTQQAGRSPSTNQTNQNRSS